VHKNKQTTIRTGPGFGQQPRGPWV